MFLKTRTDKSISIIETGTLKDATVIVGAWQPCCVNIGSTHPLCWLPARGLFTDVQPGLTGKNCTASCLGTWCRMLRVCWYQVLIHTHRLSNFKDQIFFSVLHLVWCFYLFRGAVNILGCCHGEEIGRRSGEWRATKTVMRRNFSAFFANCCFRKILCHFISLQGFL